MTFSTSGGWEACKLRIGEVGGWDAWVGCLGGMGDGILFAWN